jgi:hypothetical protein
MILVGPGPDPVYSHRDHWHGSPVVRLGAAPVRWTFQFVDASMAEDDHDVPPAEAWFTLAERTEFDVRVVVEDPTVARWEGDRLGGSLVGLRAGASRVTFVVRRGETTIWESPPLNFRVTAP